MSERNKKDYGTTKPENIKASATSTPNAKILFQIYLLTKTNFDFVLDALEYDCNKIKAMKSYPKLWRSLESS